MDDNELNKLFGFDPSEEKPANETSEENTASEESLFVLDEKQIDSLLEETIEEEADETEETEPETEKKETSKIKKEKKPGKSIKEIWEEQKRAALSKPETDFPVKQFVLALLALVIIILLICFFTLPQFRVLNVTIDGNVVISDEEVLKEAGLQHNAHLMRGVSGNIIDIITLNYGKTEKKMMRNNPYYKNVKIDVSIPSTVNIKVEERAKVAYIRTPDGYAALDKEGIVLELSSNLDDYKRVRPVICGIEAENIVLGDKIKFKDEKDYQKAIIVLGAILAADANNRSSDYSMFAHTIEVRIIPSGFVFLTIETPSGNTLQVKLNGIDKISDDMTWLLYAINVNVFDKDVPNGALDMTGEEYIYKEYSHK